MRHGGAADRRGGLALTWSADARRATGELPGGLDEGEFFVPDHPPDRYDDGSLVGALRRTVLHAQRRSRDAWQRWGVVTGSWAFGY